MKTTMERFDRLAGYDFRAKFNERLYYHIKRLERFKSRADVLNSISIHLVFESGERWQSRLEMFRRLKFNWDDLAVIYLEVCYYV